MKHKKHFLLLLTATIAIAVTTPIHAAINLTVNAADEFRDVTHAASGSLYGLTETLPANLMEFVAPLKPKMFTNPARSGQGTQQLVAAAAIPVAERLWDAGMTSTTVTIRLADLCPGWPYRFPGWNTWRAQIESVIEDKLASRAKNFYGYEIWNEWHGTFFGTWQNNAFQYPEATWSEDDRAPHFYELWKNAFNLIREKDPTAKIIGPSDAWYQSTRMESFLTYCVENNVVPDIVSWHELGSTAEITNRVNHYRNLEARLGISPRPISINEYGEGHLGTEMPYEGNPGRSAAMIAKIERLNIETACISWWHTGQPGRLGSLMATNTQPGAGWYFYRWYGEMSGKMITVTPPNTSITTKQVDGFANIDHDKKFISLLFGGVNHADGTVNVTFNNLPSWMGTSANVKIEGIDWVDRHTVSSGPYTISETERTITNNSLTVSVTGCNDTSGYRIYITPATVAPDPVTGYFFHHTFEDGTAQGWAGRFGGITIANTSAQKANGSRALSVSNRSESYNGPAYSLNAAAFKTGGTYSFSVIAMFNDGPDAAPFKFTLQYDLDGEPVYAKIDSVVAGRGNWVMLENANFPIPAGAVNLVLYIEMPDNATTSFFIDDAMGGISGAQAPGREGVTSISGDRGTGGQGTGKVKTLVSVRGRMLSVSSPNNSGVMMIRVIDTRGKVRARFNANGSGNFLLTKIPAGRYFIDVKGAGVKQTLPIIVK